MRQLFFINVLFWPGLWMKLLFIQWLGHATNRLARPSDFQPVDPAIALHLQ